MRRGDPSGLVLRAHRDHGLAVRIQRDRDHDRPAADLAVLDVMLVTGGAVAEQFDRLAAVRASGMDGGQHPGPPAGRFQYGDRDPLIQRAYTSTRPPPRPAPRPPTPP